MINPDGCYLGNYRTDSTGVDLNRMWAAGTEALEPPLYHIKRLAEQLHASDHVSGAVVARMACGQPFRVSNGCLMMRNM